ncbi:MAG: TetR family transcriptional regulator [Clostridiales bacterium]|nr:TetR family transcriptional regulator [Clostridiales bacterium]
MIKKTFYNLPEEKRNRIIEAVMNEFASTTTEKVSINRIVKAAKISRGSFYQYFDDKVDLVEVLMSTFIRFSLDGVNDALRESDGDIFYTYVKLYDIIVGFYEDESKKVILKNLFKNIKANDDLFSDYMFNRFNGFDGIGRMEKITDFLNKDKLKFKQDEDVEFLTQILSQVLKEAIFNVFVVENNAEDEKKIYLRKLEIIKAGASESA